MGMDDLFDLSGHGTEQEHDPGDLDPAAGASRTGSDKHKEHQDGLGHRRPHVKVRGGKSCGGDDGAHLEGGVMEGCDQVREGIPYEHRDDQR